MQVFTLLFIRNDVSLKTVGAWSQAQS